MDSIERTVMICDGVIDVCLPERGGRRCITLRRSTRKMHGIRNYYSNEL